MQSRGWLKHGTVVTTVMSNLGLSQSLKELGIETKQTAVGDRYVMEEMRKGGYNLGGEQSGHLIFLDYNTTGDGLLSALQLVNVMKQTNKPLSELASEMQTFPQKLVNIRVANKHAVRENEHVRAVIEKVEAEMNGEGRVLVRPSGTEPLVRIMVEAKTEALCDQYMNEIASVVKQELQGEEC